MTTLTTYVSTGTLDDEIRHYFDISRVDDGFIAQNLEDRKIFIIGDSVETVFDNMEYFATVTLPFFELCRAAEQD